jgi:hypothetical protein
MALRQATRQKAKIRLAISGPTGSGKSYTALLIGNGLVGDWSKIAVIDTENNSADLYAHLGPFLVNPIEPPYSTEKYINAIKECVDAGMECVIIDSISHEWSGQGGVLQQVDNISASSNSNNKFTSGWKQMTPKHDEFMAAMLHANCHIIATMRSKQEYTLVEDGNKKVPKKLGLAPVQREGVEYEFTLHLDMANNNFATALKDRTEIFKDGIPFKPTVETGVAIKEWCETGVDTSAEVRDAIEKLQKCDNIDDLTLLRESLPAYVILNQEFRNAGIKRHAEITKQK